jgi:hypothetical protein
LIFHLLRKVMQYFIVCGRSHKLVIFKGRRMKLYSSLKLQRGRKGSPAASKGRETTLALKSARELTGIYI